MSIKFPNARVVTHTTMTADVSSVQPMSLPSDGLLAGVEEALYGVQKPDPWVRLLQRWRGLPERLRFIYKNSGQSSKLVVLDFLSAFAQQLDMLDVAATPSYYVDVKLHWTADDVRIELVSKHSRGQMLINELEQLETTVELRD